jgi:3-phenylpropionate/cinnamic acid dioxygenase small subunit
MSERLDDALARAVLRAEIEELLIETAYLLDRGRFDEVVEHYTEDCEITRPLPPFATGQTGAIHGRTGLAQSYAGPEWPRTARTMRHVITNVRLTPLGDGRIAATSTWTGYRHEGSGLSVSRPMAVGDYEDELRRDADGRWRIHRRNIVIAFLDQELLEVATRAVSSR